MRLELCQAYVTIVVFWLALLVLSSRLLLKVVKKGSDFDDDVEEYFEGAIPGTFFWRPRFGLDLAIPTTEPTIAAYQPNQRNIHAGLVVLVDGYDVLTSIIGLALGIQYASEEETMNPLEGIYYTNIYRWAKRTIDLLPYWIRGNFHDALSVWCNRFKYMDSEVPDWLRKAFPWVSKASWNKEHVDLKKYRKDSEVAFSPFYRFPSKTFNNFNSFLPLLGDEIVFSSDDRDNFIFKQKQSELEAQQEKLDQVLQHPPTTTEKSTIHKNTTIIKNSTSVEKPKKSG